jgi:hypothetical protein
MSRTEKHPPAPDRFTKRSRTGAHAKRAKVEKAVASYNADLTSLQQILDGREVGSKSNYVGI